MQGRITTVDGTPIAGAIVSAGLLMDPIPGICAAVTDAEGRYKIADLNRFDLANQEPQPAGNGVFAMVGALNAQVRHPDYSRQPFDCTKIPSTVDVTLHRAAIVEGQVVLSDSEIPASAHRWNSGTMLWRPIIGHDRKSMTSVATDLPTSLQARTAFRQY